MIAEVRLDATKRKACVSAFRSQSGSKPEPTTVFMPSSRSRQSNTLRNRKYVLIEPSEHICHNLQAHVRFQREGRKKGGRRSVFGIPSGMSSKTAVATCPQRGLRSFEHLESPGAGHAMPHTSIGA
jgi:hypothetical protein